MYAFLIFDYRDIGVIKTLKHRLSSLVFNYIFGVKTQRNTYSLDDNKVNKINSCNN